MRAMRATKPSAALRAGSEARNRGLPKPRVVTIPDYLALDGTLPLLHRFRRGRAIRSRAENGGSLLQLPAEGHVATLKQESQSRAWKSRSADLGKHPRIFFAKDISGGRVWATRHRLANEMPIPPDRSRETEPGFPASSPSRRRHYRVTIYFEDKMPRRVEQRKKTNPP